MNSENLEKLYEEENEKLEKLLKEMSTVSSLEDVENLEQRIRLEQIKIRGLVGLQIAETDLRNFKTLSSTGIR